MIHKKKLVIYKFTNFKLCYSNTTSVGPHSVGQFPILSKVYEKLVSHKLSSFSEKYGLLPAAQFAYRKGLGCTDALLTVSHHLQKFLDAGILYRSA